MKIQIHQMLHGYNQGHNLIQSSIILSSSEDMDCIATLSDWSEYTNPKDEADYVTIYPLQNSEYYIISKTWYAGEMKRPGCVWTHSFLIPFSQLSQITDFRIFTDLFVRPQDDNIDFYAKPLLLDSNLEYNNTLFDNKLVLPSLSLIYNRLINQHPQVFSIENKSLFYQHLCFILMNYFPYQILCQLSFCSGSARIRTLFGKPFFLQFINAQYDVVKSVFTFDKSELNTIPSYIDFAAQDIVSEKLQLSRLIHTFAEDIGSNYQRLNALLILIELINKIYKTADEKENAIQEIITNLATFFPNREDGKLVKERFLQKRITEIFVPEYEFLYYMCISQYIGSFSVHSINFWERFQNIAHNEDRHLYYKLLQNLCKEPNLNDLGESVLIRSNDYLTISDLDYIANKDWPLFQSLISACPDILNRESWITYSYNQIEDILRIILTPHASSVFKKWKELLVTLLKMRINVCSDLGTLIFQKDPDAVYYVLDYLNSSVEYVVPTSIEKLCKVDGLKILNWMDGKEKLSPNVGILIMRSILPTSAVVKSKDSKRWISFSKLSIYKMPIKYYAYLYVLSFNWLYDQYAIEFMRISFYPLHKAASEGKLEYDIWKDILPFTEDLPLWLDWDRCKKMRKAVVRRIFKSGNSIDIIKDFTPDKDLNKELIKTWKKMDN